jgi:SAM-dependent methyltransferase
MAVVAERDWYAWHDAYDAPDTPLAGRLAAIQDQIRSVLDAAPPGPLRAISICAGQGRDLIGALATHPRRADVTARLVELDPRNAAIARQSAEAAGLPTVEVVTGDAALTGQYADLAPADLVLACGIFGNISAEDIKRTVGCCAQLCAQGGTVVWTRRRDREPELFLQICAWFTAAGFAAQWIADPATQFGAAAHRLTTPPSPLEPRVRMFTFKP